MRGVQALRSRGPPAPAEEGLTMPRFKLDAVGATVPEPTSIIEASAGCRVPWIDNDDTSSIEVRDVPRRELELVANCRGREQ